MLLEKLLFQNYKFGFEILFNKLKFFYIQLEVRLSELKWTRTTSDNEKHG